jgi:ribosomal protein L32
MAIQRKCPSCGTWNLNNDYCLNCNTLISPIIIEEEREKAREERRKNIPLSKADIFINNWKNSRFFLLRWLYKIVYTISVIFIAIASFFAWMAASPNG